MDLIDPTIRHQLWSVRSGLPLLSPLLSFLTGITAAHHDWLLSLILCTLCVIAELTWRHLSVGCRESRRLPFLILVGLFGFANLYLRDRDFDPALQLGDDVSQYEGSIESFAETNSGGQIVAELRRADVSGDSARRFRAILFIPDGAFSASKGDGIRLKGRLKAVSPLKDVDEEIDVDDWLLSRGIVAKGMLLGADAIDVWPSGLALWRHISAIVDVERSIIDTSDLSPISRDLLKAFLTADGTAIVPAEHERFAIAGVSHLLAISGAHVMIIAAIFDLLLLPFLIFGINNRVRKIILVVIVWLFATTCSLQPSVFRAAVMFSVVILADIFQRRNSNANSVALAAIIILAVDPKQLYEVGFLLSFGAVCGILAFMPERFATRTTADDLWQTIKDSAVMSVAAMSVAGAISAYYFHTFPVYFLIANILVAMVMPWLLAGGVMLLALGAIGIVTYVPAAIVNFFVGILVRIVDVISGIPYAVVECIYFDAWVFIPYVLALLAIWCALRSVRRRRVYLSVAAGLMLVGVLPSVVHASAAEPEWIVVRNSKNPLIVANDGDTLGVYGAKTDEDLELISRRFRVYIERRRLHGPVRKSEYRPVNDGIGMAMASRRCLAVIGNDTILLVDDHFSESDLPDGSVDYAVFGSKGAARASRFVGSIYAGTVITPHAEAWAGSRARIHDLTKGGWRRQIPSCEAPRMK